MTTRAEVFEQLLDCWMESQRELAEETLGDRHAQEDQLKEEREDWWSQWRAATMHPPAWKT